MRSRRLWIAGLGVLVLLGCLVTLAARTDRRTSTSGWVELQAGRYGSVPWRLWAREQNHTLCLALQPGNPGDASAAGEGEGGAGGCGFNTDQPGGGYYASGPGPADVISSFGPLPTRATAVRVAQHQTVPSYAFPAGHGMPAGRYWLFIPPAFWPNPASGPATDPQPLDEQGNPVPFSRF